MLPKRRDEYLWLSGHYRALAFHATCTAYTTAISSSTSKLAIITCGHLRRYRFHFTFNVEFEPLRLLLQPTFVTCKSTLASKGSAIYPDGSSDRQSMASSQPSKP
jgi:hypothetical protein